MDEYSQAKQLLSDKLSSAELSLSEIAAVKNRSHRFIPKGQRLDAKELEKLRTLAILARSNFKQVAQISSHRPFIGKFIVLAKRLIWPFFAAQLKPAFKTQEQFNMLVVKSLAEKTAKVQDR